MPSFCAKLLLMKNLCPWARNFYFLFWIISKVSEPLLFCWRRSRKSYIVPHNFWLSACVEAFFLAGGHKFDMKLSKYKKNLSGWWNCSLGLSQKGRFPFFRRDCTWARLSTHFVSIFYTQVCKNDHGTADFLLVVNFKLQRHNSQFAPLRETNPSFWPSSQHFRP